MVRKPTGIDVRKTAAGTRYRVRWRDGGGRDGRQCSHTFTDRYKAEDALREIRIRGWRCACPKHGDPGDVDLPQAAEAVTWGAYARRSIGHRPGIGPSYRARFKRELSLHCEPLLDVPLGEVDGELVEAWIRKLELAKLSPTTIRRLKAQAGSVQQRASDAGLTSRGNPFRAARVGRADKDPHEAMTCLTRDEWHLQLKPALPEGMSRDLGIVLAGTGMRWSEATALAAGAVDLAAREVHVVRSWKADGRNGFEIGVPKSVRSRRTIPVDDEVAEALARHIMGRRRMDLVFTTVNGAPVRNQNWRQRVWLPAIERSGLKRRPRIHDLRHSFATWLVAAGVPLSLVSRLLGHENYQTTDRIYSHVQPRDDEGVRAALRLIMKPPPGRSD